MSVSILVVDDEPDVADALPPALSPRGARGHLCDALCQLGRDGPGAAGNGIEPTLIVILSDINCGGTTRASVVS